MPRPLRIDYPGAIHHVMSRGDRRDHIYLDDVDRQEFLKTLAEACLKTDWKVHAYCLMPNHFHLVVETPEANLVAGMHWLLSTYTIRLNRRHDTPGHVFSGRYKALVVEGGGGGYLKTVCDYVHLNPVRAKLLGPQDRLLSYPWSSLGWYLAAKNHRPGWMRVDRLLGEHGIRADTAASREEFERRMEALRMQEDDEEALAPLRQGWCLGSQGFREEMLKLVEQNVGENHDAALRRESAAAKAERILAEELARRRWTRLDLESRRKSDAGKLAIAARLKKETILPLKSIAVLVHLGSSKSANANLHRWTQAAAKQEGKAGSRTQRKGQGDRTTNHTKVCPRTKKTRVVTV
ncbi:MAG: transposase [Verrucomicrobia bacterium]|nr:transposase [Verrucomicrobiota bacterium]